MYIYSDVSLDAPCDHVLALQIHLSPLPYCLPTDASITFCTLLTCFFVIFFRMESFTLEARTVVLLLGICPAARSPHALRVLMQLV